MRNSRRVGDGATALSEGVGREQIAVRLHGVEHHPAHLAITQFLGFPKYGHEYKVKGPAPYGQAGYQDQVEKLIRQ